MTFIKIQKTAEEIILWCKFKGTGTKKRKDLFFYHGDNRFEKAGRAPCSLDWTQPWPPRKNTLPYFSKMLVRRQKPALLMISNAIRKQRKVASLWVLQYTDPGPEGQLAMQTDGMCCSPPTPRCADRVPNTGFYLWPWVLHQWGVPGDCWWRGVAGWPSGHEDALERCTLTVFAHSRHLAETWLREEENISICGKYSQLGSYCRGVPIMAEATGALSPMMWCQPLGWWDGWASGSWSPNAWHSPTWSLSQGHST